MANQSPTQEICPLWRLIAGAIALAIAAFQIVGYQVARSINLNYFKDPSVPMSALDVALTVVALYLLLIAIFGRWRIHRKHP